MRGAILAAHGAPAVDAILDQLRPENAALLLDDERSRRKVADRDRDAEIARADAADAECKRLQSVVDLYVGRQEKYEAWLMERDAQSAELDAKDAAGRVTVKEAKSEADSVKRCRHCGRPRGDFHKESCWVMGGSTRGHGDSVVYVAVSDDHCDPVVVKADATPEAARRGCMFCDRYRHDKPRRACCPACGTAYPTPIGVDADPCPPNAPIMTEWGYETHKGIAWLYRENNRRKEALAHAESAVSEIVKLQAAMVEREAELTARVEKLEKGGAK